MPLKESLKRCAQVVALTSALSACTEGIEPDKEIVFEAERTQVVKKWEQQKPVLIKIGEEIKKIAALEESDGKCHSASPDFFRNTEVLINCIGIQGIKKGVYGEIFALIGNNGNIGFHHYFLRGKGIATPDNTCVYDEGGLVFSRVLNRYEEIVPDEYEADLLPDKSKMGADIDFAYERCGDFLTILEEVLKSGEDIADDTQSS